MAPAMSNNIETHGSFENDIPVFDVSEFQRLLDGGCTADLESFYLKIRTACEKWGCFQVVNHEIDESLLQSVDIASRDLFNLPKEIKEKNVSATPFHGYIGPSPMTPFYESLGISGAPHPEAIQRFSEQLWPIQENPKLCETIQAYAYKMQELANTIHKIILASLGISKYYESHFNDFKGVLRLNRYAVFEGSSVPDALVAHTDGGSIAVAYEDIGGLEVLSNAGEWVTVRPPKNSFVVIIGDSLQAWSNKRCRSAKHRVIVKEWKNRHSVIFFQVFPDEMEISAPAELVDDQHPRLYRPFLYSELGTFRAGMRGQASLYEGKTCAVDVFAGVSTYE